MSAFDLPLPREAQPQVAPEYTAAVSEPFFDAAKCHRAAIRACITLRRLANEARRNGDTAEHARLMDSLAWHRARAAIWKEMANG